MAGPVLRAPRGRGLSLVRGDGCKGVGLDLGAMDGIKTILFFFVLTAMVCIIILFEIRSRLHEP